MKLPQQIEAVQTVLIELTTLQIASGVRPAELDHVNDQQLARHIERWLSRHPDYLGLLQEMGLVRRPLITEVIQQTVILRRRLLSHAASLPDRLDCQAIQPLLEEYAKDDLPSTLQTLVDTHLATCPTCPRWFVGTMVRQAKEQLYR